MQFKFGTVAKACLLLVTASAAMAASHREAPFITTSPKVDGSVPRAPVGAVTMSP